MAFNEMDAAVSEAKATVARMDNYLNSMADMMDGRLRKISGHRLAKLKRQLRKFNIHTNQWRE